MPPKPAVRATITESSTKTVLNFPSKIPFINISLDGPEGPSSDDPQPKNEQTMERIPIAVVKTEFFIILINLGYQKDFPENRVSAL